LRKFVSRSEIEGILRDILINQRGGFNIKYLSSNEFIDNLLKVQEGKKDDIVIKVTDEELAQFNNELYEKVK